MNLHTPCSGFTSPLSSDEAVKDIRPHVLKRKASPCSPSERATKKLKRNGTLPNLTTGNDSSHGRESDSESEAISAAIIGDNTRSTARSRIFNVAEVYAPLTSASHVPLSCSHMMEMECLRRGSDAAEWRSRATYMQCLRKGPGVTH